MAANIRIVKTRSHAHCKFIQFLPGHDDYVDLDDNGRRVEGQGQTCGNLGVVHLTLVDPIKPEPTVGEKRKFEDVFTKMQADYNAGRPLCSTDFALLMEARQAKAPIPHIETGIPDGTGQPPALRRRREQAAARESARNGDSVHPVSSDDDADSLPVPMDEEATDLEGSAVKNNTAAATAKQATAKQATTKQATTKQAPPVTSG